MIANRANYVPREPIGDWADDAACKGMNAEIFFPSHRGGKSANHKAQDVCDSCRVTAECLEYAN